MLVSLEGGVLEAHLPELVQLAVTLSPLCGLGTLRDLALLPLLPPLPILIPSFLPLGPGICSALCLECSSFFRVSLHLSSFHHSHQSPGTFSERPPH